MKIVVAPDKFKGSMTSAEAGAAIARGLRFVLGSPELVVLPMADGGEGTVAALLANGFTAVETDARDALGRPCRATFAVRGDEAVIEMSAASGLARIAPAERDAARASTAGTGDLVRAALDRGCTHIAIAVGGSATTDGGAGLLSALGLRLLGADGETLPPGGAALAGLATVDRSALDPRLASARIELACDVDAALHGPRGAALVFAPQKGATPEVAARLDAALARFADVSAHAVGRDERDRPGAGAGGGIAFGCLAYLSASIGRGFDLVASAVGLDAALAGAGLCITGEGRIDAQTLGGKVVASIGRRARRNGVRAIAFAGSADAETRAALLAGDFTAVEAISPAHLPERDALAHGATFLEAAAARFARTLL